MKRYRISLTVLADPRCHAEYIAEYPGFADESIPQTLLRECIAQLELEGLINTVLEEVAVEEEVEA